MACEVCEHCDDTVRPGDGVTQDGYSYHDRCMKCYVCGETNLKNAERFKGVIFCSGCSRRIFKGCSTVRKARTRKRKGTSHKGNGVIEIAKLNSLMASDSESERSVNNQPLSNATEATHQNIITKKNDSLKKDSVDMATTTDVTQELLKHIYSSRHNNGKMFTNHAKRRKRDKSAKQHKNIYSDMRIAELGASTEIAHMTLRRQSEVPVIIKSGSALDKITSKSISYPSQDSNGSNDSDYSDYNKMHWMDRRFRSIIIMPYKSFKRNILTQSSRIDSIVSSENKKESIIRKIKMLFREEITEHQRRGLRKLFSTINRKKKPYKLGWLEIMAQIQEDAVLAKHDDRRCKHFGKSHSYRCMRSHIMKLAGPTRSELAVMRMKLKNFICFGFLKNLYNFNKQFIYMMTSKACT